MNHPPKTMSGRHGTALSRYCVGNRMDWDNPHAYWSESKIIRTDRSQCRILIHPIPTFYIRVIQRCEIISQYLIYNVTTKRERATGKQSQILVTQIHRKTSDNTRLGIADNRFIFLIYHIIPVQISQIGSPALKYAFGLSAETPSPPTLKRSPVAGSTGTSSSVAYTPLYTYKKLDMAFEPTYSQPPR